MPSNGAAPRYVNLGHDQPKIKGDRIVWVAIIAVILLCMGSWIFRSTGVIILSIIALILVVIWLSWSVRDPEEDLTRAERIQIRLVRLLSAGFLLVFCGVLWVFALPLVVAEHSTPIAQSNQDSRSDLDTLWNFGGITGLTVGGSLVLCFVAFLMWWVSRNPVAILLSALVATVPSFFLIGMLLQQDLVDDCNKARVEHRVVQECAERPKRD